MADCARGTGNGGMRRGAHTTALLHLPEAGAGVVLLLRVYNASAPAAQAQTLIPPVQGDLVVPPTLLNLIHRNCCSRAANLANSRDHFYSFVILKVNKNFQGQNTTLIFL